VPYVIRVDEGRNVVIVEAIGNIDAATATPMVTEARAAAAARAFDILYDFRQAAPGDLKAGDVFWFPRRIPALAKPEARRVRIALLYPEEQREFSRFWETTFQNAGLRARAFDEEAAAFAWLAEAGA